MKSQVSKSFFSIVLAIGLFLPIFPALANTDSSSTAVKPELITVTGTIRKIAVSGTCYQLAADSGKKYELMGKFPKIDGTRVRVSGVVVTDIATICQVGQPLKIDKIRKIR